MKVGGTILSVVCLVLFCFLSQAAGSDGDESIIFLGFEGYYNTFYGRGAGNSSVEDNTFNTFIGVRAGYSDIGSGFNNFVGYDAGHSNTTGNWNNFIGVYAGYHNTTGDSNNFFGEAAGYENITGNSNNFFGYQAGYSNTTGSSNNFFGYQAGYSNNTGSFDSFFGNEAGQSNTGGYNNSFLGYRAGYSNTGGFSNSFLGYQAGYSNTTGNYNSVLGNRAGYANTEGNYNTFLGSMAGDSNTIGDANTIVGWSAGGNNTEGNNNTFIGALAGNQNAIGERNVFLGYSAGYYETGSQKLYISNSSTSTPLIYGDFNNRKVTLNGNLEVIGPDNGLVVLADNNEAGWVKKARIVLKHRLGGELPVYLFGAASANYDNFVAFGGGATIGNAATQIDFFTAPTTTTPVGTARITIKGNGNIGIGTQTPSYPLHMAGGAYSNGGSWINASSREYKENIESLDPREALMTLASLDPVKFNYKSDASERHVGFIAEDVPGLVATKDRKGLSSMDIVAVLTKVVQEQQKVVQEQQKVISAMREELDELKGKGK